MANTFSINSLNGYSTALNSQPGQGTQKPTCQGKQNPGDTKPPKPADAYVPMPK